MIICFAKKAGQTFLGYWYLLLPGGSFADFKIQLGDFKLAKHHIPLAKNPYPTGNKHTISIFVDQTHIQRTRPRR